MARHRIGLSQAWQVREGEATPVWVRPFGRPTGLSAGDRVMLVVEGASIDARLAINGSPLTSPGISPPRREWDVTLLLLQRNELVLVPDAGACPPDDPDGEPPARADRRPLWPRFGAVCLEIIPADDLDVA